MNLQDIDYVKGVQSNLHATFDTPQGKEVMKFLETMVGYDASIFDPTSKENTWIRDGGRQVVATIKTLLKHKAEDIVSIAKQGG
jgi:hypothetical protein